MRDDRQVSSSFVQSRRRFLVTTSGVIGASTAGFLRAQDAHAGRTFTVASSGGSWGKVLVDDLMTPFGTKHGLTMRHDVKGNVQRLVEIVANKGQSEIDVVEISGSRIALAMGHGLLERLDPARMPNLKHIPPAYKNDFWVSRVVCPLSIVFNPKHVTRAEAQSWDVLLNPKFKGHVGLPEYTWQGENWLHSVNLLLGGTYEDVSPGIQFARKAMRNGGSIIKSPDHGVKAFAAGELWVGAFLTSRAASLAGRAIPLEFAFIQNWWPLAPGFGIVKGSPNADLAAEFINMSLQAPHQIAVTKVAGCPPTSALADLPPELKAAEVPKDALAKAAVLDYARMFKVGPQVLDRWNREVLAG